VELGQTSTFGGARAEGGGGTGNQTYHGWIAAGLPGRLAVLGFLQGNDDPTWARLDGVRFRQETFTVGGGLRVLLRQRGPVTLAAQATLERLELKSDPGLFTRDPGMRRTAHSAASASVMAGVALGDQWHLTVSPGAVRLPREVNRLPYYGWTGMLGLGVEGLLAPRWRGFVAGEAPLGPGGNSLAGLQRFRRTPVVSAGIVYDAGPRTRVTVFATNSAGGSPATRHLTQVGEVPLQWGARVRFSPTAPDGPVAERSEGALPPHASTTPAEAARPMADTGSRDAGGVAVSGTGTVAAWRAELRAALSQDGSRSARLRLGLSRISELELGAVQVPGLNGGPVLGIRLGGDVHYRVGGKLVVRRPGRDGGLGMAARVSVGRDAGTLQGYLVAEFPMSLRLHHRTSVTLAPLLLRTGGESPLALAAAAALGGPAGTELVLEPTFLLAGGRPPWTMALRLPARWGIQGDFFVTTALSTLGAGRFLATGSDPHWGVSMTLRPR
jgi:hypothetical protein